MACRELGFPVSEGYWPQSEVLAFQVGSQIERPVCVRCRKTTPCYGLRHKTGRFINYAVWVVYDA